MVQKSLSYLAALGLLAFAGCGGGSDEVASINLRSSPPEITGGITFDYSGAQFESSGKGWRILAKGGFMLFTFSGQHGFRWEAAGNELNNISCSVNIIANGVVYDSGSIPLDWAHYVIPASAFSTGENTVKIEQTGNASLFIIEASVGDGSAYEKSTSDGGDGGGAENGRYTVHIRGTLSYPGAGGTTYNTTDYLTVNGGSITISATDGPYAGTIESDGHFHIEHTMYDGSRMIFDGYIYSNGTVKGTYTHSVLDGHCDITGSKS